MPAPEYFVVHQLAAAGICADEPTVQALTALQDEIDRMVRSVRGLPGVETSAPLLVLDHEHPPARDAS